MYSALIKKYVLCELLILLDAFKYLGKHLFHSAIKNMGGPVERRGQAW